VVAEFSVVVISAVFSGLPSLVVLHALKATAQPRRRTPLRTADENGLERA